MQFFCKTFSVLCGVALLGVVGVGGFFIFTWVEELFAIMAFQVGPITTIASVVALLAAKIIASSIRKASKQNKANQLYAEKAMTYQRFIDIWEDLFRHGRDSEDRNPHEVSEGLLALDHHLILYGGSGVVKAHAALRVLERDSGAQDPATRSQFAKALIEIRNDLGSGTHDLTAEALQQLFFTNFERVSASTTASTYQDLQPRVSLASNS